MDRLTSHLGRLDVLLGPSGPFGALLGSSWDGQEARNAYKTNGFFNNFTFAPFRISGPTLDPTWAILGPSWVTLDPSWGPLGRLLGLSGRPKGSPWRPLVGPRAPLGALLTPLGGHLGPSWGHCEPVQVHLVLSWAILELPDAL